MTARGNTFGESLLAACEPAERYCYTYYTEGLFCYSTRAECLRHHGDALCEPAN